MLPILELCSISDASTRLSRIVNEAFWCSNNLFHIFMQQEARGEKHGGHFSPEIHGYRFGLPDS